jgi:hypothetical protein
VELPDGTVVGNRINLSQSAHYRITINKARIVVEEAPNGRPTFYWDEVGEKVRLKWQPPTQQGKWFTPGHEVADKPMLTIPNRDENHLTPGETCIVCKRRIPHPKKKTSPLTKVYSTRIPIDSVDTFKEILDAAAEHAGLKSKPHHEYNTILVGLTLILQSPKEHLPGTSISRTSSLVRLSGLPR